ncbi:MAG: type 2 isopentenyl-diphosphate Delta-isomerase [Thermoplasmata archaeon]|nr:type 2 isopentenyl-diphosphate Delta-isomerase [Candidatus Sysuiplasma acidicola]
MPDNSVNGITEKRKGEHVDIVLNKPVNSTSNYWDDVTMVHNSLPEIDFGSISTETEFLGRKIGAPIVISGMTGGFAKAKDINRNLAEAASALQIPMGVGSQRAALENPELAGTYSVVSDYDIPLTIANIGAPQLIGQKGKRAYRVDDATKAMEMINADVLAIHMNYLQEVVQPEGDRNANGVVEAISSIAGKMPVMAKETGAGVSRKTALMLKKAGVKAIDVGGLGGTSWSAVEYHRARSRGNGLGERLGKTFWNWGIPTPVSVTKANVGLPVVASGGIRNGLDAAKAICLGASCAGLAGALIRSASESSLAVKSELMGIIEELRVAMFLTGSQNVRDLSKKKCIISGMTGVWIGVD